MAEKRTLLSDRRGAIVVMAVFMAALMVGCLWYLIGIGDAIVYRQKMQDSADAAAYVSAVYHARGMNIIAVMNLIMAVVLAILIALKIIQIISGIVTVVAAIFCPFAPPACEIAVISGRVFETLTDKIIPKADKFADKILKGLSFAQKGVAIVTPWVGSFQGFQHVSKNYKPSGQVENGIALSVSMIPLQKERIGLPVQEMPFEKLCERAGTMVGELVTGFLPSSWSKFFGSAIGSMTKKFSGFFCGGGGVNPGIDNEVDASAACSKAQKEANQAQKDFEQQQKEFEEKKKAGQPTGAPPKAPEKFDINKCKNDVNKGKDQKGKAVDQKKLDGKGKTAKEMYKEAENGNDFFGVYGLVNGNLTQVKKANKGVVIPAWSSGASADDNSVIEFAEKVGFARADFYYDQLKGADGGLKWSGYKDEALWHIQWRARMRRFHLPTAEQATGLLGGGIPSNIPNVPPKFQSLGMEFLGAQIEKVTGANPVTDLFKQDGGQGVIDLANQLLGGASEGFIIH